MTAVEWGRVSRGVVWHLVAGHDGALCDIGISGSGSSTGYVELTDDLPPRGGRPCPRCCREVEELAETVREARLRGTSRSDADEQVEAFQGRPIEDVDLVGALADRQTHLRDAGPDPQADELDGGAT